MSEGATAGQARTAHGAAAAPKPRPIVIRPRSGWRELNLSELRGAFDLLYFFVWRDLKVRYKQTALGVAWVVLQPLFLVGVFSFVFGKVIGVPHGDVPYPIFALGGLVTWALFVSSLTRAATSVVSNQHLVSKVYFPRLLLPSAAVLAGVIDGIAGLLLLAGFMVGYGFAPGPTALAMPAFLLLAIACAFAVALWLSAINVRFRDVQYTIPFLVQVIFFATPVVYSARAVPEDWRWVVDLNPIAVAIAGVRWSLLGVEGELHWLSLASVALVIVLLGSGLAYFRRTEHTFADEL